MKRNMIIVTAEELKAKIKESLSDNAEQEAGWLVSRATAIPVSELFFQKRPLTQKEIESAEQMAERRRCGEPLQYILGDEYFGDLLLKVGKGCLIPRPETWGIVEFLQSRIPQNGLCCELGVGSGAISLALAQTRPDAKFFGSEISPEALYWANRNRNAYDFPNVEFRQGSLFEPFREIRFHAAAANLPYIPYSEKSSLQREVREHEPDIALFAEESGTALIRKAIKELESSLLPGGIAIFEMGSEQTEILADYSATFPFFSEIRILKDCFGNNRFLTLKK